MAPDRLKRTHAFVTNWPILNSSLIFHPLKSRRPSIHSIPSNHHSSRQDHDQPTAPQITVPTSCSSPSPVTMPQPLTPHHAGGTPIVSGDLDARQPSMVAASAAGTRVPVPPFALELAAGTAGGAAQLCVGHPFDTAKVMLQRGAGGGASALCVARSVVAADGVRGLYAGVTAPLPFVAALTAALFATNAGLRAVLARGRCDDELSLQEVAVAGAGAGAAVSAIAGPVELVKCRMQHSPGRYTSAIDCARRVYAAGGARAFAIGLPATLAREVPGTALFFGVYEAAARAMRRRRGARTSTPAESVLAGGLAGLAFWIPCYPADYLKTVQQTGPVASAEPRGLAGLARDTVHVHGVRGLYRGVGPALARSFPASAATFLVYEKVKQTLGGTAEMLPAARR